MERSWQPACNGGSLLGTAATARRRCSRPECCKRGELPQRVYRAGWRAPHWPLRRALPRSNGVNLNRDFPDPIEDPSMLPTGREQPETKAVMAWVQSRQFIASANMHEVCVGVWEDEGSGGASLPCLPVCIRSSGATPPAHRL